MIANAGRRVFKRETVFLEFIIPMLMLLKKDIRDVMHLRVLYSYKLEGSL